MCVLSEININKCFFNVNMSEKAAYGKEISQKHSFSTLLYYFYFTKNIDPFGRCRWSLNVEEHILFMKWYTNRLNILDVEKKELTLKSNFELDRRGKRQTISPSVSPLKSWIIYLHLLIFSLLFISDLAEHSE